MQTDYRREIRVWAHGRRYELDLTSRTCATSTLASVMTAFIKTYSNPTLQWPTDLSKYHITNVAALQNPISLPLQAQLEYLMPKSGPLQLLVQWIIEITPLLCSNYYMMEYQVVDRGRTLGMIADELRNKIISQLKYHNQEDFPQVKLINCQTGHKLDLDMKFMSYRELYLKSQLKYQFELILVDPDVTITQSLAQMLEASGFDLPSFLCPITLQVMTKPCFLIGCRHYFQQTPLRLTVDKYKKQCPVCKAPASLDDIIPDPVMKKGLQYLFQQYERVTSQKKAQKDFFKNDETVIWHG